MPLFQEELYTDSTHQRSGMVALALIGDVDTELAVAMTGFGWFADGIAEPLPSEYGTTYGSHLEELAVRHLRELAEANLDVARAVWKLGWLADDRLSQRSFYALKYFVDFARGDPELGVQVAETSWVVDGIREFELDVLGRLLNPLSTHDEADEAFARQMLGYTLEEPDRALGFYVARHLQITYPKKFEGITSQPWFRDGLDREERVLVTILSNVSPDEPLFEDLMRERFIRSRTVRLPQAGEVTLWMVDHEPFPAYAGADDPLTWMENAVRASERIMGVPFPTTDAIMWNYEPERQIAGGGAAFHQDTYILVRRDQLRERTVAHETAHYYFDFIGQRIWLNEGGAEFITRYTLATRPGGSMESTMAGLERDVQAYCYEAGFEDLHAARYALHDDTPLFDAANLCRYYLGAYLFMSLLDLWGEAALTSALSELYLTHESNQGLTEEPVYQLLVRHTPPGLEEATRDLFRRIHGGPFIDG